MKISSGGDVAVGTAAVTGGRYFDIYNTGSTATDFAVTRFITQQVGSSSTTSADIYKRKNGEFGFANYDTNSAAYINFTVGTSERMRINSSGNVGIGTDSPSSFYSGARQLVVGSGSGEQGITMYAGASSTSYLLFADGTSGTALYAGQVNYDHNVNAMNFCTNGVTTPRMLIDASGNLLVGKTATGVATVGTQIEDTGGVYSTVASERAFIGNRTTTDGSIIELRKDNATVGTIGTESSGLLIGSGNVGVRFIDSGQDRIIPRKTTLANADAAIDLGDSGSRFKDLYLSGGAYIGGTAAANHLDDYEEGTWTPTYVGTTTNPSVTYDVQNGYYTKVGRKVTCHFAIRTTAITTQGVGVLQVAGLPFSCANVANIYGTGSLAFGYNFAANNGPITGYVNINSNKFTLVKSDSDDPRDGISAGVDAGSLGTSGAGNYLAMTFTYITA
jgi:hypothetical protein